jgi:hypothetical protein
MTRRRRRVDVAIYAPLAGAFYESNPRPTGGAELQSVYIARALAERGFRVRHIVAGSSIVSSRGGVETQLLPDGYTRRGLARRRAVVRALREADARLYVQRSAGSDTAVVGLFARATRRRFVFSSSSVADFARDPVVAARAGASLDEWPTRAQYLLGLRLANTVVVQTEDQRLLARAERGVESRVIRSFCSPTPATAEFREAFLWVGGLVGSKDPLTYVELARQVPEATFWMVASDRGGKRTELGREVHARVASAPNLRLLPPAGRDEILALYPRAIAVVGTSWFEGFPNTFLEGWARGTPALSLRIDPDCMIEQHELGTVCGGSFDALVLAAKRLWHERDGGDPERLRKYVERVHGPAVVGEQWAALVRELLER